MKIITYRGPVANRPQRFIPGATQLVNNIVTITKPARQTVQVSYRPVSRVAVQNAFITKPVPMVRQKVVAIKSPYAMRIRSVGGLPNGPVGYVPIHSAPKQVTRTVQFHSRSYTVTPVVLPIRTAPHPWVPKTATRIVNRLCPIQPIQVPVAHTRNVVRNPAAFRTSRTVVLTPASIPIVQPRETHVLRPLQIRKSVQYIPGDVQHVTVPVHMPAKIIPQRAVMLPGRKYPIQQPPTFVPVAGRLKIVQLAARLLKLKAMVIPSATSYITRNVMRTSAPQAILRTKATVLPPVILPPSVIRMTAIHTVEKKSIAFRSKVISNPPVTVNVPTVLVVPRQIQRNAVHVASFRNRVVSNPAPVLAFYRQVPRPPVVLPQRHRAYPFAMPVNVNVPFPVIFRSPRPYYVRYDRRVATPSIMGLPPIVQPVIVSSRRIVR